MGKLKEVLKKDINGNIIKRYYGCKEAANELGIKEYDLSRKIKKGKFINGFIYEYSGVEYGKEVDKTNKIKCPYCDFYAKNYNGLCKHVFKSKKHPGITKEQLLTDVKYNGIRPTCKCGCGGYTTIINTNGVHFAEYIQGHWNSVINNWGHNKKAQENSAKTRREQYNNGERVQWNKGKKWNETYSEEKQNELYENLVSKLRYRMENSEFSISSKLEDDFVETFIKPYNIGFKRQYYIPEIKQFCDLYIPSINLIIEINGTYWHCDRRVYNNGPINNIQEEKIKRDELKYSYLRNNGFRLLVIWEDDIKNKPLMVKMLIDKLLFNDNKWEKEILNFISSNDELKRLKITLLDLTFNNELNENNLKNVEGIKIFEDEWLFNEEIVKSRLLNAASLIKNKIYARNCVIKQISYKESSVFLNKNHLQGKITGSHYYGLYYNDILVSVMVFGKMRKNLGSTIKDSEYELLRFCSEINTNVIGGAGKLFNHFIKEIKPNKIISYCDKRWGDGAFYEKIGMTYSHDTQCNYYYVNELERKRENRFKYRKDILVKTGFDKNKTEKQIMIERGIYRIYDEGCKVFLWYI